MDSTESDSNFQESGTSKKSPILKILKRKERKITHLQKLNDVLKNREVDLNRNDQVLDGSYLHYLTQTAKTNDEYF